MVSDFKWPQTWISDIAVDQQLGAGFLGTLEVIYGNDINNVFMRNADLVAPVRTLPDGRPFFGGAGGYELNPDGGAGIYVIDNTAEGYYPTSRPSSGRPSPPVSTRRWATATPRPRTT